jgi:Heterokaryon incompatibility protein (HET)
MKTIYEQSSRVIVWLGPGSNDSDKAMELVGKSEISTMLQGYLGRQSTLEIAFLRNYSGSSMMTSHQSRLSTRCPIDHYGKGFGVFKKFPLQIA